MEADKYTDYSDLSGIYQEIARELGRDGAITIHQLFHGQQISFPKRLYAREYVLEQVNNREEEKTIGEVAQQYGYTERRIRQLIQFSTGKNN